jgi:hypothetical protein
VTAGHFRHRQTISRLGAQWTILRREKALLI